MAGEGSIFYDADTERKKVFEEKVADLQDQLDRQQAKIDELWQALSPNFQTGMTTVIGVPKKRLALKRVSDSSTSRPEGDES